MFEHRRAPLLPFRTFLLRRVLRSAVLVAVVIISALAMGVLGYHLTESMPWLDSLLNASMILSGMGPVNELHTTAGKLFASFYAIFSGVVFITTVGILGAPFSHRLLHRFHLEVSEAGGEESKNPRRASHKSNAPE